MPVRRRVEKEPEFYTDDQSVFKEILDTVYEKKATGPTLAQTMHGNPSCSGWDYYQLKINFKKCQDHLKMTLIENQQMAAKLKTVRDNYLKLTELLNSVNPTTAAPYLKYAYDPRLF